MNTDVFDVLVTSPKIDPPDEYSFRNMYLDPSGPGKVDLPDMSEAEVRAALRVLQHVHYRTAGIIRR